MDRPVTILGAGLVGICSALSLAERGVAVRIIERGEPGQETSSGNAGVISPWSFVPQSLPGLWRHLPALMFGRYRPLSVRLAAWPRMIPWGLRFLANGTEARVRRAADAMELLCAPSVALFRRHLQGTGGEGLVVDCAYVHALRQADRARLDALDYRIRAEKGARLELVGADELHRIEPALSPDFRAAILIHGQARARSPGRIGEVLAAKARGLGVAFLRDEVRAIWRQGETWQIECNMGEHAAQRIVVAMGAWSASLLKGIGLSVPMMAERGYHVEFPGAEVALNNSVMDVDAKIVASSMEGGLRVAGQAEFASVDAPPSAGRLRRLTGQARGLVPGLEGIAPRTWMGRRPSFPDSLPMIGAVPGRPGLFVNFGHSHYGLMMAPKSGELLADLMTGRAANADPSAFSPSRFGGG